MGDRAPEQRGRLGGLRREYAPATGRAPGAQSRAIGSVAKAYWSAPTYQARAQHQRLLRHRPYVRSLLALVPTGQ